MLSLTVLTNEASGRNYKSLQIDGLQVTTEVDGVSTTKDLALVPKTVTRMKEHFETLLEAVGSDKANTLIHNFLINKIQNGSELSKHLIANNELFSDFVTQGSELLSSHGKTEKAAKEPKATTTKAKTDKTSKHISSAMAKLSVLFVPDGTEVTRERIERGVENLRSKITEGFDWSNVVDQAYEFASAAGTNPDGSLRRRKAAVAEEVEITLVNSD